MHLQTKGNRKRVMAWITFLAIFFLLSHCTESKVVLPESMSVMLGQEATFFCAGEALTIVWTINGTNIDFLGILATVEEVDGVPRSNLTINGSVENNNVSIQCLLVNLNAPPLLLPPVFLTVLGIGPVPSLTLADSSCIQWEEPVFRSDDVTDLMYYVSLSGANLSPLLTITTSEIQYCTEPELTHCQEYTITVTPFSTFPDYIGTNSTISDVAPGDNYHLEGHCTLKEVEFAGTDIVMCSFTCQVAKPLIACPLQSLHILTNNADANYNSDMFPMNSSLFLDDKTSVVINVTGLPARKQYYSYFSILDKDGGVVDNGSTLFFSTYSVQKVRFSYLTNTSRVGVTCTFAINASASACFVLFENLSLGLEFNGIVDHPIGSLLSSGVVDIPQNVLKLGVMQGLSSLVFDVKVYDMNMYGEITDSPAFEQEEALEVKLDDVEPSPDLSAYIIAFSSSRSLPPSVSVVQDSHLQIAIGITGSLLVLILLLLPLLMTIVYFYKQSVKKQITEPIIAYATSSVTTTTAVVMDTDEESQRAPETSSDIVCLKSVAYAVVPRKQESHELCKPAVYDYVSVKCVQPKSASGDSQYTDLGPRPLDAPTVLPELDGKTVVYSDVRKHTVSCAEPTDGPANAQAVLSADRNLDLKIHVQY